MNCLVRVEHLSICFKHKDKNIMVVDDIAFRILAGQVVALVGESGSGKTMTAKSLMGLIKYPGMVSEDAIIDYKQVNLNRLEEQTWNNYRGNEIAMVFQDALVALNPTMKVGKQVIESLTNHFPKMSERQCYLKAVELLELIEIPDAEKVLSKYPHQLSGGMRQRIMIASAIISHPKLLIADEPTTSLDVTTQAQIIKLLKRIQTEYGMSMLLITHNLGIVAEIADYIYVMKEGRIIESGPTETIFYQPQEEYTQSLLAAVPTIR